MSTLKKIMAAAASSTTMSGQKGSLTSLTMADAGAEGWGRCGTVAWAPLGTGGARQHKLRGGLPLRMAEDEG